METILDAWVADDSGQTELVVLRQGAVAVVFRLPARHVGEDASQMNGGKDGGGDADEDADGGEYGAKNLPHR